MPSLLRVSWPIALVVAGHVALTASGCSFVVDGALRDRLDAAVPEDAGPPVTACTGRPNGTFCDIEGLTDREICLDGVCVVSSCGDGFEDTRAGHPSMIPPLEVCDDGNPVDGDGCDLDCTYSCDASAGCPDDDETCNGVPRCDAASHTCTSTPLADGMSCVVPGTTLAGLCRGGACTTGACPDTVVDPGEECDDGNTVDDDGCEADCTYTCEVDGDCQDGDACNGAEVCDTAAHTCSTGTPPICDDDDACTTDGCSTATGCTFALIDADGDGYAPATGTCAGGDCDDGNAAAHPGAVEACGTTADLNCDGTTGVTPTWYADCDRDGYAATGASTLMSCTTPTTVPAGCSAVGWTSRAPVSGAIDCQPTNSSARPGQSAYFSTPIGGTNYDYDCSGSSTTEFGRRDVRTFVECGFVLVGRDTVCGGTTYWDETTLPACGSTATQSYCRVTSLLGIETCIRSSRETVVRCH